MFRKGVFFLIVCASVAWCQTSARDLARLLAEKGVITQSDLTRLDQLDNDQGVRLLTSILQQKGIITSDELARAQTQAPVIAASAAVPASATAPPSPQAMVQPPKSQTANNDIPVTTESKIPVSLYGTVLLNGFYNTAANNISDIPLFASPAGPGPVENFAMTARQTRLGLRYKGGPQVAGANLSGQVEIDFFGGKAALANGINMDLPRIRLAFGRLDWHNFSIEAGQDWAIFAPLNPTSLAEYAIPSLSGSGNLWIRSPQIRTEWKGDLGGHSLLWQLAALDPDVGDNPIAFATARQPKAGELGQAPAVESRLALSTHFGDREATIGASGHWNRAKNVGTIGTATVERTFQTWGAAVDFNLPILKQFALSGEAFAGRALGIFTGDIGQSFFAPGTQGEHGIGTRGGWAQAQFNWTSRWQTNAAYGIEVPIMNNLTPGARSKNQTYMVNLMYKVSPAFTLAWEWRRFLTNFQNQPLTNNTGDHANVAVAYTF